MRLRYAFGLAIAVVSSAAISADLGTYGEVYEISEQDMFQRISFQASGADFKSKAEKKAAEAKQWFESAPQKVTLPTTDVTRSYMVRHVLNVISDHKVPVFVEKSSGRMVQTPTQNISNYRVEHRFLARKGDKINVLDNPEFNARYAFKGRFLVFNPDNEVEKNFVMEVAQYDPAMTLITTHGDILGLSEETGKPVHLLYPSLESMFRLERTPSLLGVADKDGETFLSVTQFGPEQTESKKPNRVISQYWNGPVDSEEIEIKTVNKYFDPSKMNEQIGGRP